MHLFFTRILFLSPPLFHQVSTPAKFDVVVMEIVVFVSIPSQRHLIRHHV